MGAVTGGARKALILSAEATVCAPTARPFLPIAHLTALRGGGMLSAFRLDEAILTEADQILPADARECLADKRRILGSSALKQCALKPLFVIIPANVNLAPR